MKIMLDGGETIMAGEPDEIVAQMKIESWVADECKDLVGYMKWSMDRIAELTGEPLAVEVDGVPVRDAASAYLRALIERGLVDEIR